VSFTILHRARAVHDEKEDHVTLEACCQESNVAYNGGFRANSERLQKLHPVEFSTPEDLTDWLSKLCVEYDSGIIKERSRNGWISGLRAWDLWRNRVFRATKGRWDLERPPRYKLCYSIPSHVFGSSLPPCNFMKGEELTPDLVVSLFDSKVFNFKVCCTPEKKIYRVCFQSPISLEKLDKNSRGRRETVFHNLMVLSKHCVRRGQFFTDASSYVRDPNSFTLAETISRTSLPYVDPNKKGQYMVETNEGFLGAWNVLSKTEADALKLTEEDASELGHRVGLIDLEFKSIVKSND
jgi:hypothetical protein